MTTVSVFLCPSGAQYISTDASGNQYAACATGQGSYQSVDVDETFDPSALDSVQLSCAFLAGFVVMGTGACASWAAAAMVRAIKEF